MENMLLRMKDYSKIGSWAVWESHLPDGDFQKEADLIEDIDLTPYLSQLQPSNKVIIAMNPGGVFEEVVAKTVSRKQADDSRPWSNFHNVGRSRDFKLAKALNQSSLRGSYMTDFFPIIGSGSSEISRFIKKPAHREIVVGLVKELDEELSLLLPDAEVVDLICVGNQARDWANLFLINPKTRVEGLNKQYQVYSIPHYSGAANGHITKLAKQRGIKPDYPEVVKAILSEQGIEL